MRSREIKAQYQIRRNINRDVASLMDNYTGVLHAIGEVTNSFLLLVDFHQEHHQLLAPLDRQQIESSIILTRTLLNTLIRKYPNDGKFFRSFIDNLDKFDRNTAQPELREILRETQRERSESQNRLNEAAIAEEKAAQEKTLGQEIDLGEEPEEPVGPKVKTTSAPASTPREIKKALDDEVETSKRLNKEIKNQFINQPIKTRYNRPAPEKRTERERSVKPPIRRQSSIASEGKDPYISQEDFPRVDSLASDSTQIEASSDYPDENRRNRSDASRQSEQSKVIEQPGWLRRNWKALAIATFAIALFTVATIFTFGATGIVGAGVAAAGSVWAAGWSAFPAIGAMSAGTAGIVILDGIAGGITMTGLLFAAKEGIKNLFSSKPPSSEEPPKKTKRVDLPKDSQASERSYNKHIGPRLSLDYSSRASDASATAENVLQYGRPQRKRFNPEDFASREEARSSFNSSVDSRDSSPGPGRRRGSL